MNRRAHRVTSGVGRAPAGVAGLVAVVLGGCVQPRRPLSPPPRAEEPVPPRTVIQRFNANADRMPHDVLLLSAVAIQAGLIDEDGEEHRFDGDGKLHFVKPSYLYLYLNHGLARKVVEIGSDKERYWLSYEKEKTVWWGKHEHLDKPRIRDMPIRPDQLIAALGLTRLPDGSRGLLGPRFRVGERPIPHTLHPQYRLGYFWPQEDGTLWLDREYGISRVSPFLAERIVFEDRFGRLSCEATLADLGPIGVKKKAIGGPAPIMPHRIYLRVSKENNFLSLKLIGPHLKPFTPRLHPPGRWPGMNPQPGWQVIQIDEEYDRAGTTSASASPFACTSSKPTS